MKPCYWILIHFTFRNASSPYLSFYISIDQTWFEKDWNREKTCLEVLQRMSSRWFKILSKMVRKKYESQVQVFVCLVAKKSFWLPLNWVSFHSSYQLESLLLDAWRLRVIRVRKLIIWRRDFVVPPTYPPTYLEITENSIEISPPPRIFLLGLANSSLLSLLNKAPRFEVDDLQSQNV